MTPQIPPNAFGHLPPSLRDELLSAFNAIVHNYGQGKWEPSELNGGKLCAVIYSILRGHIDGAFPPRASKPPNMVDACRAFEQETGQPRAIRIQIPRILIALYEIRNNRGVGHVGGDVNPNHMDAVLVVEMAKWLMAELLRIFHKLDIATATSTVEALIERSIPIIWHVGTLRRVLAPSLSQRDRTLLLLYPLTEAIDEGTLARWVEPRNASAYRRDVLRRLHGQKLVEYDVEARTVRLSPIGARYVEENLPFQVQ